MYAESPVIGPPGTTDIPDLKSPSVRGLSYLLRHKELWPKAFRWNYVNIDRCAMGLAQQYWYTFPERRETYSSHTARILEIDLNVAYVIFMGAGQVSPSEVADLLDKHSKEESLCV